MVQGNRGGTLRLLAAVLVAACMLGCADEPGGGSSIKWKKSATLPSDLPKDVPVYPNAAFQSAIVGEGVPIESGAFLGWTTKDDIPAVRHWLTEKLDAEGWHVISYPGVPAGWMGEGGVTVVATKWGRTASYAIGAKDGATLISLVLPQK
jgi:hypothetical protein